jgi:hypothetical protein
MPDWKKAIQERFAAANLDPASEVDVVGELAQHLDDCHQELQSSGLPDEERRRRVLSELDDCNLLC